jgi:hypothetical protein
MDLAGAQRLTCFSQTTLVCPYPRTVQDVAVRPSSFRMMGLLVGGTQAAWFGLDRLQVQRLNSGRLTQTFPAPA